jgi:two-component system response regulator AtoC
MAVTLRSPQPVLHPRVLVVDDEPLIRWSIAETLSEIGWSVVEAGDARGALCAAREGHVPFTVVVLDLKLPDSQDLSLLARLRELLSPVEIIVMTAHGTPEIVTSALAMGARSVLHKPFGLTELTDAVSEARRLSEACVQPVPPANGAMIDATHSHVR